MNNLEDIIAAFNGQIEELKGLRYALLIWLKSRELGAHGRAEAAKEIEDEEDKAHYLGRWAAYRDAWRQVLWPGRAVEDGTLEEAEFKAQEEYWSLLAQAQREKIIPESERE